MGETSIPCTEATRNRLRDDKTEGVSWDRYLNDLIEDAQAAEGHRGDDLSELASAVGTIETRTGKIEQLLEGLEGRMR